jgi:hypothetical protein
MLLRLKLLLRVGDRLRLLKIGSVIWLLLVMPTSTVLRLVAGNSVRRLRDQRRGRIQAERGRDK